MASPTFNLYKNDWSKIPHEIMGLQPKERIDGIEVRGLPLSHFLGKLGKAGVFATRKWFKYDIIGEYCGMVCPATAGDSYVAAFDNIDAVQLITECCGNEMRFINSYLSISFSPNVVMKTVYVDTTPIIVIVCIDNIDIDDEILLDYGERSISAN